MLSGWSNKTNLCLDKEPVDEKNMCKVGPCEHDSYCRPKGNGYECLCVPGYTGSNCEEPMPYLSETQSFPDDINIDSVDVPYTPEVGHTSIESWYRLQTLYICNKVRRNVTDIYKNVSHTCCKKPLKICLSVLVGFTKLCGS